MFPCNLLVHCHAFGCTGSSRRQGSDGIEHGSIGVVFRNDCRTTSREDNRTSGGMEGNLPDNRGNLGHHHGHSCLCPQENAKRQFILLEETAGSDKVACTVGHIPADTCHYHRTLHGLQLHRAVPRTDSRLRQYRHYTDTLRFRGGGYYRQFHILTPLQPPPEAVPPDCRGRVEPVPAPAASGFIPSGEHRAAVYIVGIRNQFL